MENCDWELDELLKLKVVALSLLSLASRWITVLWWMWLMHYLREVRSTFSTTQGIKLLSSFLSTGSLPVVSFRGGENTTVNNQSRGAIHVILIRKQLHQACKIFDFFFFFLPYGLNLEAPWLEVDKNYLKGPVSLLSSPPWIPYKDHNPILPSPPNLTRLYVYSSLSKNFTLYHVYSYDSSPVPGALRSTLFAYYMIEP